MKKKIKEIKELKTINIDCIWTQITPSVSIEEIRKRRFYTPEIVWKDRTDLLDLEE